MAESVRRAVVVAHCDPAASQRQQLNVGEQITFGRDATVTLQFPAERRLSRLAGAIRGLPDGVVVTNLSATHDLNVRSGGDTVRLAASVAGRQVAGLLLSAGTARITWPGATTARVEISVDGVSEQEAGQRAVARGRTTHRPLTLNPRTKEFAVALLLSRPRLRAEAGATASPSVPELTRQLLVETNSFRLLDRFDSDPDERTRCVARTHEHLKILRDKLVRAELVDAGVKLSPDGIADLLVAHNVLRPHDLALLTDEDWLGDQERRWES